jgi:hypothetical protein
MKIFISWSGEPSHNVALALKEWLPSLFPTVEPFVSSEDIRKGKRWQIEIAKELETSNFGIVCLTPGNTEAPWLLFESGALSKSLKESNVSTLLTGGLRPTDIEGPLSHFQHTSFEKEDFLKLVNSINDAQPSGRQDLVRLRKVFDKFWDELATSVEKALKTVGRPEKKRSVEDMVRETLELATYIAQNIPEPSLARRYLTELGLGASATRDLLVRSREADNQNFEETWDEAVLRVIAQNPEAGELLYNSSFAYSQGDLLINFPTLAAFKRFGELKGNDVLRHILDAISRLPVTAILGTANVPDSGNLRFHKSKKK